MNHEPVRKLHRLGTSRAELSRHDNLAAFGTRLHDKAKHTIARPVAKSALCGTTTEVSASPTDGETTKQLVSQTLALCNGGEAPGLHLLGIQFEGVLGEFESFLDEGGKLANTATFLAKDFLGMGGTNDNLQIHVQAVIRQVWQRVRTSVRACVTRTSQPEYPSSESSRVKNSFNSARKTPSATNLRFLLI